MITATTWDGLAITSKVWPVCSPDRVRLDVDRASEGLMHVRLVALTPQEGAAAKRARKAQKRGASVYSTRNAIGTERPAGMSRGASRTLALAAMCAALGERGPR